jgi:hypothetical protein
MYSATLEYMSNYLAVLTLFDAHGEWAGASRIEGRNREELYEHGYSRAAQAAEDKDGRLERFRVLDASPTPDLPCPSRVTPALVRRLANALNVEPIQPWARCLNKRPVHWPEGSSSLRWLASGGEAFVFGPCSRECPRMAMRGSDDGA